MDSSVEIDGQTERALQQIAGQSRRPIPSELHDSVNAWYRSLIGDDGSPQLGIPFKKRYSERDADIVLRQKSATDFVLEEPFRFQQRGEEVVVVERGNVTDLASVPSFLTWLVPRYGRHTLPALLHDHLVVPGMDPDVREQADTILRDAMGSTKVPLVRRWSMWAAVSLATRWQRSWRSKLLVVAWIALYGTVGINVFLKLLRGHPLPAISSGTVIVIVLASPLVLSLIWGGRYRVGLITAYSVLVLLAPLIVVGITLLLYWIAEGVAQAILRIQKRSNPSVRINPVRLSKL